MGGITQIVKGLAPITGFQRYQTIDPAIGTSGAPLTRHVVAIGHETGAAQRVNIAPVTGIDRLKPGAVIKQFRHSLARSLEPAVTIGLETVKAIANEGPVLKIRRKQNHFALIIAKGTRRGIWQMMVVTSGDVAIKNDGF